MIFVRAYVFQGWIDAGVLARELDVARLLGEPHHPTRCPLMWTIATRRLPHLRA